MAVGFLAPTRMPMRVNPVRRASESRKRVHASIFSKCTDWVNTEGSVRRGTRVSPP
jgi:hypothetical protein